MKRRWGRGQPALRLVAAGGLVAALLATGPAGAWPAWWLVVLVSGLAVGHGVQPESPVGIVAGGLVLVWWGVAFRDGLHPLALVAAAGLLVSHLAGTIAGLGPGRMAVDPATVRLWAVRGCLVFPLAPVAWLAAGWVRGQPEPAGIWVIGLLVTTIGVVAVTVGHGVGGVPEGEPTARRGMAERARPSRQVQ